MAETYIQSRPVKFPGTLAERYANRNSHRWCDTDGTVRCIDCDCNAFGTARDYPCGVRVPRENVEVSR